MTKLKSIIEAAKKNEENAPVPAVEAQYILTSLKHHGVVAVLQVIENYLKKDTGANSKMMRHLIGTACQEIEDRLAGKDVGI
jgi:hypothetical protein